MHDRDGSGSDQALAGRHKRIGHHFQRAESRRRALAHLQALVSPWEWKNGRQRAESIDDTTQGGVQSLVNAARSAADAERDELDTSVVEQLGASDAVLVMDATSFRKRGDTSAGAEEQSYGTTRARVTQDGSRHHAHAFLVDL